MGFNNEQILVIDFNDDDKVIAKRLKIFIPTTSVTSVSASEKLTPNGLLPNGNS